MQYKNVFEDFFFSTTATTLTYRIEDENGESVFIGRAVGDSAGTRVNVAQKIRDWLFNEIGDFRESDGEFFDHPDAIHAFSLVDMSDNAVKEQWMVIYSFQPWNGDTLFLTTAINTHASPLQKLFITNGAKIDVPTHRTQEITDGGGGDGPEGGDLFFHCPPTAEAPYEGGNVTIPVSTNYIMADVTVVLPSGVTLVSKSQTEVVVNVPANTGLPGKDWTVKFAYNGSLLGQTVIEQAGVGEYFVVQDVVYIGGVETLFDVTALTSYNLSEITVSCPDLEYVGPFYGDSFRFRASGNTTGNQRTFTINYYLNGVLLGTTTVYQFAYNSSSATGNLGITALENGTHIAVTFGGKRVGDPLGYFYWKKNSGSWNQFDFNGPYILNFLCEICTLDAGDTVFFYGDYIEYFVAQTVESEPDEGTYWMSFIADHPVRVKGNPESIVASNYYHTPKRIDRLFQGDFTFTYEQFNAQGCGHIWLDRYADYGPNVVDVSEVGIPKIPTEVATSYPTRNYLFRGQSKLVSVMPELTKEQVGWGDFRGCTSLVKGPDITSEDLVINQHANASMREFFKDCQRLSYVRAMFADTSRYSQLLGDWLSGVSASGTFMKKAGSVWTVGTAYGIPAGWTVVEA